MIGYALTDRRFILFTSMSVIVSGVSACALNVRALLVASYSASWSVAMFVARKDGPGSESRSSSDGGACGGVPGMPASDIVKETGRRLPLR